MPRWRPLLYFAALALTAPSAIAVDGLAPKPTDDGARVNPNVGIEEKIGAAVPLDTPFRDEQGRRITLRECLIPGKPAILVLAYYRCPMLCNKVRNGLLDAIRAMPNDFSAGKDFTIVNVSFDYKEHHQIAADTRGHFLEAYGRPGAESGCRFLTGERQPIQQLTEAVGFKYEYDKVFKEYDHPSGIIILTPEGKVARYFYGIGFKREDYKVPGGTTTLRLSLVEASEGKVGSLLDRVILSCYRFNHIENTYSFNIMVAVRAAAVATVLALAGGVAFLLRRERRKAGAPPAAPPGIDRPEGVAT